MNIENIIKNQLDFEPIASALHRESKNYQRDKPDLSGTVTKSLDELGDAALPYCLQQMFVLNKARYRVEAYGIYWLSKYLDRKFDFNFYFNFGINDNCPYEEGEKCDVSSCSPSRYLNCSMDAPGEILYQSEEYVNDRLKEEFAKRGIEPKGFSPRSA